MTDCISPFFIGHTTVFHLFLVTLQPRGKFPDISTEIKELRGCFNEQEALRAGLPTVICVCSDRNPIEYLIV